MPENHRKIVQALNLLARSDAGRDGQLERLTAIKLLYLADRYHLRKYGRPVTMDNYVAMKLGPVGSLAKNLTEDSDFLDDEIRQYASNFIEPAGQHAYATKAPVDTSLLSETDLEALEFSVCHFAKKYDRFILADMTHVFPEWKKHEAELREKRRADMSYDDFFEDPAPDDPQAKRYQEAIRAFEGQDKEAAREVFKEWWAGQSPGN